MPKKKDQYYKEIEKWTNCDIIQFLDRAVELLTLLRED
jgi:hypothetical protein